MRDLLEDGRIVKGVNTTVDVDTDEIKTQAAKFGNTVDKDGRPPTHKKKVKGSTTNVLFNLGLTEGYKLQLERDRKMLVLNITNTKTGHRTEVRGKPGYESGNYDPNDDLHQLLDTIGKSANIAELINGEVVTINPKHPDAEKAKKATDKAYTATEWAIIEGGHTLEETTQPKTPGKLFSALMENVEIENYDHLKGHGTDVPLGKYLYHVTYAEALEGMLEDGHMNVKGPAPFHYADYFSMTADPKYSVAGRPEVQIIIDAARVSKMETFEKYVDDWESTPGAGDWAKGDDGDWESEYRVEETIPLDYIVAVKILKSKTTPEIIKLAKKRGVKLVGKDTNVLENFADGKKKGKSRPGRVKRAGASCNGSVTSLRKRAKNSSGEKARMYHWCANMKSGRKKK